MFDPLDPRQIARIESVHRGFLYQHLYAAGCLLLAGRHGVRSVIVEFDEDVELALESGDYVYLQVKTRSSALVQSDINDAFDRFKRLRIEHQEKRRSGRATFVIVANVQPGPELQERVDAQDLPESVLLLTPGVVPPSACLPPAWSCVADSITWCTDRAQALPMAMLAPETLVWKLAGRVMLASAGQAPGHSFHTVELHTLFEQLVIQLQQFPAPPEVYRQLEGEPLLDGGARVRIVSGFSGAGKTAWAAHAALHLGGECAYYDVGDVPGPAIAASLVRELAAQWAAPSVDGLRQVLLPGATGIEALRALDRFIGANNLDAIVVLDNAHRVPSNDLRILIEASQHLRIVLLAQPSVSITEVEAVTGLQQELLHGWGLDQAAAEVQAQGAQASASDLGRLLVLTGGLPLYVHTAARLSADQYGGDVAAMCAAVEAHSNLIETAQELILNRLFEALPEPARNCVAVMSLSDVPLGEDEAATLVKAAFGITASAFASAMRQLRPLGVVRVYGGRRVQIHDAFRTIGLHWYAGAPSQQAMAGREALKDVILRSFEENQDIARFPLFVRTLVELGDLKPLIDIGTEEWFHELGVNAGIWESLEAAAANKNIDPEQRFYALDGLVFAEMKSVEPEKIERRLQAMEEIVREYELDSHEELVVLQKRMLFESEKGNEVAMNKALARAKLLAPPIPEYQRILRYDTAYALFMLGKYSEAEAIARKLVEEYFKVLGLSPQGIFGLSNQAVAEQLTETDTLQSDLKHLADSLDIVARATNAQGGDAGLARLHAAKFYALASAVESLVKVSQDIVDEMVGRADYIGARQVIENNLLPMVLEYKMFDKIVPVRSQYAVVLGYCGEYDAADAELDRLDPYHPGLTENGLAEIVNQRKFVAQLRQSGVRPGLLRKAVSSVLHRIGIQPREVCHCGSGLPYKRCHGRVKVS